MPGAQMATDNPEHHAYRKPSRWENPDVFDLHRPFQQHLGTGIGPHMCLGRSVAATEISVALEALFKEFPNIRFDTDVPTPYLTGGLSGGAFLRCRCGSIEHY